MSETPGGEGGGANFGPMPDPGGRVAWLRSDGPESDVVLSSRVRLARNLLGRKFRQLADHAQMQEVLDACRLHLDRCPAVERARHVGLHEVDDFARRLMVERQLISMQHAKGKVRKGQADPSAPRGVTFSSELESVSVMINEEDHLRLQVIRPGLAMDEAWALADRLDDEIEQGLTYAFHSRFGYLTACPTNVGTGARFSVMLHLPALRLTGHIEKVKRAADAMNLAVRGFYGEGSEALGDLYQISNQTTLGKTEQELKQELHDRIIPRVVEYERHAREELLRGRRRQTEDTVWRAMGSLLHARLLNHDESMTLLSRVRLGLVTGLLGGLDQERLTGLWLLTQPAHLQQAAGQRLNQNERREVRADLMRRWISGRNDA